MYGFNLELRQGFFLVSGVWFITWDSRRAVGMARGICAVIYDSEKSLHCPGHGFMTSKALLCKDLCSYITGSI